MFTRHLWPALLALSLAASPLHAHQGGKHPTGLDECDDVPLALAWFKLYGEGVNSDRDQDPFEPQVYTISNSAPPGYTPKAVIKLGWAIGAQHITGYDDFILVVNIGGRRSYTNLSDDIPPQWTINPYVDGWTGTVTVTLTHMRCPISLKITANWSLDKPTCPPCRNMTCAADAQLGSVDIQIPVGITDFGSTSVNLHYYSKQITNEGVAKLAVRGPVGVNGATVTQTDDTVTSVVTGDHHAAVIPEPSPEDPNRFRVEVSYDKTNPVNTIYREGIVENIVLPGGIPAVRYTDTVDGRTNTHVFTQPDTDTWILEENNLRRTTRAKLSESAAARTHRITIEEKNAAGNYRAISVRDETETKYAWGWEKTREVLDPAGKALTTSWDHYDHTEVSAPDGSIRGRGLLQSVTFPTGRVRSHLYYDTDPLDPTFTKLTITRDAFAGNPDAREERIHSTVASGGMSLTERAETWVNGIRVEHTDIVVNASSSQTLRTETRYPSDGGPPQITSYKHDSNPNSLAERETIFPDGTAEIITGRYFGGVHASSTYRGVDNPHYYGYPVLTGTEERRVLSNTGQLLESGSYRIRSSTAFRLEERFATNFDALSRPTAYDVYQGTPTTPAFTETTEYGCCGISRSTGRDGIPNHFFYDPLGRLRKTHQNGLATETIYDGLTTRTHLYPESVANSLSLATAATEAALVTRNLAGDITAEATRSPHDNTMAATTIETTYNPGNGIGRRVTRTHPATPDDLGISPTVTAETWLDGRPASRTGTLVIDRRFHYGATTTGITATTSLVAADGSSYQPVTTQYNWLLRPISRTFAGDADGNGQPDRESLDYDTGGRLVKQTDPDGVVRLWSHDLLNETTVSAIDLSLNGEIDPDLDEVRITRSGTELNAANRIIVWSEDLVGESPGTDTPVTRDEIRADGLETWHYAHANGSTALTHTLTSYLPALPGSWDTTVQSSDQNTIVQRFRKDLLNEDEAFDANGTSLATRRYHYDSLQRLQRIEDSSGPDLDLAYVAPLVDVIATRDLGGRLSAFTYDHRGRLTVVDEPDSTDATGAVVDNRRVTAFWPHGAPREVSGTPGYRLAYTYDDAHRIKTITTFGTSTATTRWDYDPNRGWLNAKNFNSPTPGQGGGPTFTYTPAGRLDTRTDQRSIVTDHDYGADGRLTRTDYSDGTPSTIILERDSRGRIARLQDAGGERAFSYDTQSALSSVTHQPGHLLAAWSVHQSRDALHRLSGLTLRSGGTDRHHAGYAYDEAGRLDSVEADNLTAFYHYDQNHGRIEQLSIVNTQSPVLYANRSYDALNRLERISYHNGDLHGDLKVFSDHQSTRDAFGRITATTLRDDTQWRYQYHPSGELASAHRFLNASSTTRVPAHTNAWSYDGIGNRLTATTGGDTNGAGTRQSTSTPDVVNRIASRQQPGATEVFGEAPLATEVTVNGTAATRHGPFFRHELTPDNSSSPVWQDVAIQCGAKSTTGHLLVPQALLNPAYDADGNLTNDGIHTYSWDAENRLVAAETTPSATSAGVPYALVTYTYDSDSRLIQRLRFDAPSATIPTDSTRYLHAGWRCLGELNAADQLTRTLTWGLDNHDALHLGDPNGALLWLHDQPTNETHLANFDGNGNVTGLTSAQSGEETAHYLHSPFGKLLAATGPYAQTNPYRFSTHHQDPTTNLIHYGYRHLNPKTGTWMSRELLGEGESPNLYAFVGNNPNGQYDVLGLALKTTDDPRNAGLVARFLNPTSKAGKALLAAGKLAALGAGEGAAINAVDQLAEQAGAKSAYKKRHCRNLFDELDPKNKFNWKTFRRDTAIGASVSVAGGGVVKGVGGIVRRGGRLITSRQTAVVGETMLRVDAAAAKIGRGAVILDDMPDYLSMGFKPHEVSSMIMQYNRKWLLQQLKSGRSILDIGADVQRNAPSIFYQMEQNMLKNFEKLHPGATNITRR